LHAAAAHIAGGGGALYIETQMAGVSSPLPVFEYASDIYPTIAPQDRVSLRGVGISNFLFPNEPAMVNLAHSYDFNCAPLDGPGNDYSADYPSRRLFRFTAR
jgi:hypothetical protein